MSLLKKDFSREAFVSGSGSAGMNSLITAVNTVKECEISKRGYYRFLEENRKHIEGFTKNSVTFCYFYRYLESFDKVHYNIPYLNSVGCPNVEINWYNLRLPACFASFYQRLLHYGVKPWNPKTGQTASLTRNSFRGFSREIFSLWIPYREGARTKCVPKCMN